MEKKAPVPLMSEWEIAREYEAAKDKAEQIKILADLNLVPKRIIVKILEKKGLLEKKTKAKGRRGKRKKRGKPGGGSFDDCSSFKPRVLPEGNCRVYGDEHRTD